MKVLRFATVMVATAAITLSVVTPVAAWHPKGIITKQVQNQTTASALAASVTAKPGDVLKYVITVSNQGAESSDGYNDMANTVMTDNLPAGVELVSSAAQRTIVEKMGTVKPGKSVTKEYTVKVTSQKNGDVIENKACFTGNSTANDNPQNGCDEADVKVNVLAPVPTPTPAPTPTPTPTPTPHIEAATTEIPASLPSTGPEAFVGSALSLGAIVYGVASYIRSKRNLTAAQRR